MPLQATSGAASYDAFGGGAAAVSNYIEDVFSTWLYTGNGTSQTITNGIDLAGKGGLVWVKSRNTAVTWHNLVDTVRGPTSRMFSNTTNSALDAPIPSGEFTFNSNGFSLATADDNFNRTSAGYVSWTFREQPKFFDIVTYTGNGTSQNIAHNLGSVPGCIIVKRTDAADDWRVYHRSLATVDSAVRLNSAAIAGSSSTFWNSTAPTSTQFTIGSNLSVNASGGTYVAYLFAHNAGGFGLTGTDNVISCGSYTGNGSTTGPVIDLGYEPQLVLVKRSSVSTGAWVLLDTMRGMSQTTANLLYPNLEDDEGIGTQGWVVPNATGFQLAITQSSVNASGSNYIYIAIRRGPMKVPTTGTSVFAPVALNSPGSVPNSLLRTTNFPVDFYLGAVRTETYAKFMVGSRLQGRDAYLITSETSSETTYGDLINNLWDNNTGIIIDDANGSWNGNVSGQTTILEAFRRAPGFFDVVCFTVSGGVAITHNLTVRPELVIYKTRGSVDSWWTCVDVNGVGQINNSGAWAFTGTGNGLTNFAQATSTTISNLNGSLLSPGNTVVAYLFASCPGVSKVGSYTGTGAAGNTVTTGFIPRFIMIKCTTTTGSWLVLDSARGLISGNDPSLYLNTTAAEITNTDWVTVSSTGFQLNTTGNTSNGAGETYIYLAIA